MRTVTVHLNELQAGLVDELIGVGIYGRDAEDLIVRQLDRFLLERVEAVEGGDGDGEPVPKPEPLSTAVGSRIPFRRRTA